MQTPVVPTLVEFEKKLYEISLGAAAIVEHLMDEARSRGTLRSEKDYGDSAAKGSTVMYPDRRKPLYKFLNSIPYDPQKFYIVSVYDRDVQISLRNLNTGQFYTLKRAAYEYVVKKLREVYGWEIYCNVDLD